MSPEECALKLRKLREKADRVVRANPTATVAVNASLLLMLFNAIVELGAARDALNDMRGWNPDALSEAVYRLNYAETVLRTMERGIASGRTDSLPGDPVLAVDRSRSSPPTKAAR